MRFVISGGGTGGHVYPALALAEEARRRGIEVLYVGTRHGLEARIVPQTGLPFATVAAAGVVGRSVWRKVSGAAQILWGTAQAAVLLRRQRADLVIGVGGYAAIPTIVAAWLLRAPRILCEQNVHPGRGNFLLANIAQAVAVSFAETIEAFHGGRIEVTGNPVRREIAAAGEQRRRADRVKTPQPRRLLVFGGSQGARSINTAMVNTLSTFAARGEAMQITHQTGPADHAWVAEAYAQAGIDATVVPYIDEMPTALRDASLVVCRAGATSIAELTAVGIPAILVPYPHAAHRHQDTNARTLAEHGAAVVIADAHLDGARLLAAIDEILADPQRQKMMTERCRSLGKPDAAARVVDLCEQVARERAARRES